jgi:Protein of unknown function (DUF2795)
MGFDFSQMSGQIDQVLSTLPYPIDKDQIIQRAEGAGANPQVVGAMKQILPDKTYNSPEDIKSVINRGGGQRM